MKILKKRGCITISNHCHYFDTVFANYVLFSKDFKQAWIPDQRNPYPGTTEGNGGGDPAFSIGKISYDTAQSIDTGKTILTATAVGGHKFSFVYLRRLSFDIGFFPLNPLIGKRQTSQSKDIT